MKQFEHTLKPPTLGPHDAASASSAAVDAAAAVVAEPATGTPPPEPEPSAEQFVETDVADADPDPAMASSKSDADEPVSLDPEREFEQEPHTEQRRRWLGVGAPLVLGALVLGGAVVAYALQDKAPAAQRAEAEEGLEALLEQYRVPPGLEPNEAAAADIDARGNDDLDETASSAAIGDVTASEATLGLAADDSPDGPVSGQETTQAAIGDVTADVAVSAAADDEPPADAVEFASDGNYYVQVASFQVKETADQWATALLAQGFAARAAAYGGPQAGWWHAVRVGPFESRVQAETARLKLPVSRRQNSYVLPRSNGVFHVQVASLESQAKAQQMAASLAKRGHRTKVSVVEEGARTWHCVRIGPFDTRAEADGYQSLVEQPPGTESVVIPFGREAARSVAKKTALAQR